MGTVRFELRNDKPDKNGACLVRGIYSLEGNRKYFKTGSSLHLRPENWDRSLQKSIFLNRAQAKKMLPEISYDTLPTSKKVERFNLHLVNLKNEIDDIEERCRLNNEELSPSVVISYLKENKIKVKVDSPQNQLITLIDNYIKEHTNVRERSSISIYKTLRDNLKSYREKTKSDITFANIDYKFFQSFNSFLLAKTKKTKDKETGIEKEIPALLKNTTIAKHLSTLKTFINYARRQGFTISDSYKDFKINRDNLEVIALTNDEFETLFYFDLSANTRLNKVRDIFCFACSTGLRYSDMALLKWENIKDDEIRISVKKTKELLRIPLTPFSKSILFKYEDQFKPLPINSKQALMSNPKMNKYLKELCELAGINEDIEIVRYRGTKREAVIYKKFELIGVHTGRKTFATLSLEKGMSAEETMAITGHKDYRSFQRYVKVTEQRKKTVMLKAWAVN
jgi:integrase